MQLQHTNKPNRSQHVDAPQQNKQVDNRMGGIRFIFHN